MKRLILSLVLAGLIALAVPTGAAAVTYNVSVGCDDTAETPQPSHKCLTTDHMAAYFEASVETEYEACIFHLGTEECSLPSVALAGTLYQNSFTIAQAGNYEVVWFLAETETELGVWERPSKTLHRRLPLHRRRSSCPL